MLRRKPKEDSRLEYAVEKPERPLTFFDKLDVFAYSWFGSLAAKLSEAFNFEEYIARAGMNVYPTLYAARALFFTLVSAYAGYMLIALSILYSGSLFVEVFAIIIGVMIPTLTFASFTLYPSMKASTRSKDMEHELPFMAAYLSTMVRGGLNIARALERLSRIRTLPASSEEAKRILRDIYMFGRDPLSALEETVKNHPNKYYRDFVLGYTSTARRGGDVIHYLYSKTEGLFEAHAATVKRIADKVAMISEIYVILAVLIGLGFYILFAVASLTPAQAGGTAAPSLLSFLLFAYLLLPALSLVTLLLVDLLLPKMVVPITEPYKTLALSAPLGVGVALSVLYVTGGWSLFYGAPITKYIVISIIFSLSLGFIALSAPPALHYAILARGSRGMEEDVASFIRDLVEVRKTGISPERCIIYVAKRSYGGFTPFLREMAKLLSWGIPFRKAIERMIVRTRNWFVRVVSVFLAEAVDVGGGSVEILEALARFTFSLAEYEKDLRARIRPYVMMPYFGAVITTIATLLVIFFTGQTMAILPSKPPISVDEMVFYFSTSMIFNAWLTGLVAGKIGSQYTAAGFTHSTILVFTVFAILALMTTGIFQF